MWKPMFLWIPDKGGVVQRFKSGHYRESYGRIYPDEYHSHSGQSDTIFENFFCLWTLWATDLYSRNHRLEIWWFTGRTMKKKETFWELLKRLDEEAGQFNSHLFEANRYFDKTAMKTKMLLEKHEKELHKLIRKIKKPLKFFMSQQKKAKKNNKWFSMTTPGMKNPAACRVFLKLLDLYHFCSGVFTLL